MPRHVQTRSTEQPFLVYDPSFLEIIGSTPTLQVLLEDAHPIFHEAGVFIDDTIYITSNRHDHLGNGEAGIRIHKVPISRDETTGAVTATSCIEQANETVPMANGGINYKRGILFCAQGRQGEGAGTAVASSLVHVHSLDPFQGQEILNNYHGRAFNSPNDVVVHSGDGSIWFTDPIYGWEQGFRPAPALPNQVYRFDPATGDVRVVADGFNRPNGICFAPDEKTVYITDTDFIHGDGSTDGNRAATVYAYDLVATAGNAHLSNRRVFAHADAGAPDGIKCDVKGHVYSGCGDGVHVWNSRGMLIGKIAVPGGIANFCFGDGGAGWRAKLETSQGGKGKELDGEYGELFLLNETKLWYVRLGKGVRGALLNPPH
ncbi:MAG: hypothetical protein M1838_001709 [Thelocarpon superellum]|nr:MAG: hypothetical protein M1838_001709 [Thelocarpon superellum]